MKHPLLLCLLFLFSTQLLGQEASRPVPLQILCTTFPMHLFTRMIAEGRSGVEVRCMLPANTGCPHDYALTPEDMRTLSQANILITNGLGMENFLGAAARQANPKLKIVDSSQGIKNLITLHEEDHAADAHHHDSAMNPHLFSSPRQAAQVVRNIAQALSELDPDGATVYKANAKKVAARFESLAEEFAKSCAALPKKKIVIEHAVFDYLARDAGLDIVAVVEEEPGQEPAASEMLKIIATIKKGGATALFTEPQYPAKVGETIAREAKIPTASLDPVASGPKNAPLDYYEKAMRANLAVLQKFLK
ncbi:TPA: ABC transporter substrate-binding protein [Candidatus Sumerlaeota bacterium]|nr:ABC transporter substrate-binding protein [Candidatus Sumerlaeota bacterium]